MGPPKLSIGDTWVMRQTKGREQGIHYYGVINKQMVNEVDCYVIKETYEKWPKGKYKLTYLSVEGFLLCKEERYEGGFQTVYTNITPPCSIYGFPLEVGKTWRWKGNISVLGEAEGMGKILGKEEVRVPAGTFTCYHIKTNMDISLIANATSLIQVITASDLWYSSEAKREVKCRTAVTILEDEDQAEEVLIDFKHA